MSPKWKLLLIVYKRILLFYTYRLKKIYKYKRKVLIFYYWRLQKLLNENPPGVNENFDDALVQLSKYKLTNDSEYFSETILKIDIKLKNIITNQRLESDSLRKLEALDNSLDRQIIMSPFVKHLLYNEPICQTPSLNFKVESC